MDDTGTAYASQEPCWCCGTALWRLDPPAPGGWQFYCPTCEHLTMPRAAAERALRDLAGQSPTAIGVIVAWPYRLHLQPLHQEDEGMASFNKVMLLGNLTRDPDMRSTPSGTAVASFGLAINRRFRQGSETKEEVCYIDVTAFGAQAEAIGEYLTKGAAALIDGRLRWHQWEKDGHRHSKLDVVADSVQFVSRREASAVPADGERLSSGDAPEDDIPF